MNCQCKDCKLHSPSPIDHAHSMSARTEVCAQGAWPNCTTISSRSAKYKPSPRLRERLLCQGLALFHLSEVNNMTNDQHHYQCRLKLTWQVSCPTANHSSVPRLHKNVMNGVVRHCLYCTGPGEQSQGTNRPQTMLRASGFAVLRSQTESVSVSKPAELHALHPNSAC